MINTLYNLKYQLCKFSGEDVIIIFKNNNKKIINIFSFIGLLVAIIFFICFTSTLVLLLKIFEGQYIFDLIIGVFFALVICIIYIFLLYIISPTLLPSRYKIGKKFFLNKKLSAQEKQQFNIFSGGAISSIFKYGYILIISVFVAQPIIQFNKGFFNDHRTDSNFINSIKGCWHLDFSRSLIQTVSVFVIFLLPIICKYVVRHMHKGKFYFAKQSLERNLVREDYFNLYLPTWKTLIKKNEQYWIDRINNKISPLIQKIEKFDESAASKLKKELSLATKPTVFIKYERWADPPFNTIEKESGIKIHDESQLINSIYQL
jgi:hypothetical protein